MTSILAVVRCDVTYSILQSWRKNYQIIPKYLQLAVHQSARRRLPQHHNSDAEHCDNFILEFRYIFFGEKKTPWNQNQ